MSVQVALKSIGDAYLRWLSISYCYQHDLRNSDYEFPSNACQLEYYSCHLILKPRIQSKPYSFLHSKASKLTKLNLNMRTFWLKLSLMWASSFPDSSCAHKMKINSQLILLLSVSKSLYDLQSPSLLEAASFQYKKLVLSLRLLESQRG